MSVSIFRRTIFGTLLLSAACVAGCSSPGNSSDPTPPLPGSSLTNAGAHGEGGHVADPRELVLSGAVASLLRLQHLSQQEINDELSLKSYAHFLETIDPEKLFFLKEDITALKKSESLFDDELLSGNFRIAHQANEMFLRRLKSVQANVETYLSNPIDLDIKEFRETDSEKLAYSESITALGKRWGRALKLEILGRVHRMALRSESLTKAIAEDAKDKSKKKLTGEEAAAHEEKMATLKKSLAKIPTDEPGRIAKAQADLQKSYSARFVRLADIDALSPAANFINAITGSFDPHTIYMPPIEKENFDISMSGSLEGIGAVLMEQDHFIGVNEIVVGGAAWKQGDLEAGDLILSVGQETEDAVDVGDMKINRVVRMIRGPKGTTVSLTVEKEDKSIKTIAIVRDKVSIKESFAQGAIIEGKGKVPVGYINLPSFYGQTHGPPRADARFSATDVKKLLTMYEQRGVSGVVLDLRSNGGGLLDDARKMTGYFIKQGPVVQTQLPDGTIEVLEDTDADINYSGKVVVLIDRFSASASEIVAAALQDYGRAVVVGAGPTHGKGTVQGLLDLDRANESADDPPLGVLKLTVQQFFRINGSSTQKRGVVPDIGFPDSYKHLETGERNLDNALPWREVKKLPFEPWSKATWKTDELAAKSSARQAKSRYFTMAEKRGELMKRRRDETKIPLQQSAFKARSKKQLDEYEALSPPDDKKPKALFNVEYLAYTKASDNSDESKAAKEKIKNWSEGLARDPVVNESIMILRDML
ncbi:MAG: hypothetical protein GY811_09415 [Myxococcales bacterium]|nr:hypothetical protein [Myxococcales bacterium]